MRRSRRGLPTAIAAALTAVCFIAAQPAPAAAQSGKYKESPALAEQSKAGRLPPVEQRLPEQPLVVPVVEKTDEYGGVWRRAFLGPADANNYVRVRALPLLA
jgi:peptide/nickel transport system substrate-binding protein